MIILRQSRNSGLSIKRQAAQGHAKPIDTPKLTTEHFIALQREEIQLHLPEPDASSPNQETLTSHLSNPTHRQQFPQKEEPWTYSWQKGTPDTAI